jgi:hypothetical protein
VVDVEGTADGDGESHDGISFATDERTFAVKEEVVDGC